MTNQQHIDTLNAEKKQVFEAFINEAEKLGLQVIITQSTRSIIDQKRIYLKDKRNAVPGLSAHQYGFAIDINVVWKGKRLVKNSPVGEWIESGIVSIAKSLGLRWGGEFTGYADTVHFDCLKPGDTTRFLAFLKNKYGSNYVNIKANQINWKL